MNSTSPTQPPAAGQAAHTPTPWQYRTRKLGDDRNPPHYVVRPVGSEGWAIAKVTFCVPHSVSDSETHFSASEGEANAAFIVRACNSHAALVAALKRIQTKAECASGANPRVVHECFDEIEEIARAALAQAKECQS